MRHTRTKQLIRLTGGKYWEYMPNVKVDEMRKLLSDYELDKSFKWHRLGGDNWIECNKQVAEWYVGTAIIPIK